VEIGAGSGGVKANVEVAVSKTEGWGEGGSVDVVTRSNIRETSQYLNVVVTLLVSRQMGEGSQ
jgi:hypothetical protein